MKDVTFKTKNARKKFEARGYRMKKNKHNSECLILKDNKEEARISINKKGLLDVQVQEEVLIDLLEIKIDVSHNSNTILLEMEGKYVDKCRCEIPSKGNYIFW